MENPKRYLSYLYNFLCQRFLFESKDLLAMQYLAPISTDYLPWNPYAMRPSGLVRVINEIVLNKRSNILECGGGISTLYIAKILKERGGHLYTVEHDADWVAVLQRLLAEQGLTEYVSLIVAPLHDCQFNFDRNHHGLWYDLDILKDALCGVEIDLLIVDGPPAHSKRIRYARYPAVPFFKQYFARDYAVIIDDITRYGETKIADKWQEELDISFKRYPIQGGIAIAYSQGKYTA